VVRVFLLLLDADAELAAPGDATAGPTALTPFGSQGPALAGAERRALEGLLREQMDEVRRLRGQLEEQGRGLAISQARLAELTAADPLTGLMGQLQFREALESAFSYAVRNGQALSVALLDVDHFRSYHDRNGQGAGDSVLRAVARVIVENVRPYDGARQGGDQFAVVFPATDAGEGMVVAERLRSAISGQGWPDRPVTVSIGVATLTPAVLNCVELLEQAGHALLHSKHLGRDRVTHFDEVASPNPVRAARPSLAAGP
jgi:diguanylate cyclase (GGDEF)-like protein